MTEQRNSAGRFQKISKSTIIKEKIKQSASENLIPGTIEAGRMGKDILKEKVVPGLQQGAKSAPKIMRQELGRMHTRQHFWERFKSALMHKSLGLILAMFSADIVGSFFETRRAGNLWGMTSRGQLVSDETFAVMIFVVEFVIALLVFTLTDFYMEEWRERRAADKEK